jgi:hypothetical protein
LKVLQTLRFDLEELDALRLAQNNGEALSQKYRDQYTPTPSVKYYSNIQQVKAE